MHEQPPVVFGYALRAAFPLPELRSAVLPRADGHEVIRLDRAVGALGEGRGWSWGRDEATYRYDGVAEVRVREPGIALRLVPGLDPRISRLLALGPGLACWLARRHPVLHATTVRTAAGDVAILGPRGAGKSTLAAHLIARGARLVADDLSVIERGGIRVGFGRIKLWDDAITRMGDDPDGFERVHPDHAKRSVPVPLATGWAPLRRLVFVEAEPGGLRSIPGARRLERLLANHRLPEAVPPPLQAPWLEACRGLAELEGFALGRGGPEALSEAVDRLWS